MKSRKFTIILLAIIFLGSCGEETPAEAPAETTVQEAEIIEQMELPELDGGSQMFHSVYKLDDDHLLILESYVSNTSKFFKYSLTGKRIVASSDIFHVDLRLPIGIKLAGEEIIFPNRHPTFAILNAADLSIKKEIEASTVGHFEYQNDHIFYTDFSPDSMMINSVNLISDVVTRQYAISRDIGLDSAPPIWAVNDNSIVLMDKDAEGDMVLKRHNWITNSNMWTVKLAEFDGSNTIHINESKIFIYGDDQVSCRALSTGALVWDKVMTEPASSFYVKMLDQVVILGDEKNLFGYDLEHGQLKWIIDKWTGEQGFSGGITWGESISNIVYDEDVVFINMYPFDVSSGEMLWNPVLKIGADIFEKYQNRMDFNAKEGRAYYVIGKTLYQVRM